MAEFGPFERVYVENDWYDGPREGIADIDGVPHRYQSLFDESEDEYLSTFEVWPVSQDELELEIEQWGIFVNWNMRYESGEVDTESHPAHGGRDLRWDQIVAALKVLRQDAPLNVRHAKAQIKPANKARRYEVSGPNYLMSWKFL
jgi:hypothetical protein